MVATRSEAAAAASRPNPNDLLSNEMADHKKSFTRLSKKRNKNKKNKAKKKAKVQTHKPNDKDGKVEDVQGYFFQCFDQSNSKYQFKRTLLALERLMGRTFDYTQDMMPLTSNMDEPKIAKPANKKKLLKLDNFARAV